MDTPVTSVVLFFVVASVFLVFVVIISLNVIFFNAMVQVFIQTKAKELLETQPTIEEVEREIDNELKDNNNV